MLLTWLLWMPAGAAYSEESDSLPLVHGSIVRDYARITFEWPSAVHFTAEANDNKVKITFDRNAKPAFGPLLSSLYPYVVSAERKNDGKTLMLTLNKSYKIRTFMADNVGGIDILGIDANERQALHEPHSENPFAQAAPVAALGVNALSILKPSAGNGEEAIDPASAPTDKKDPDRIDPVKLSVSGAKDSAVLRLAFSERMAIAAFIRSNYLWIIMNKTVPLDLSDFEALDKTVVGKAEVYPDNPAVIRIPVDDNIYAAVAKEDSSFEWSILLTPVKRNPDNPLRIDVNTDPPAPPHVFINSLQMGDAVTLKDPVIGDELIAVPLYQLGEGIATTRDFIEFSTIETAQGVAVAKKADDINVTTLRNGLRISMPQGTVLTPGLPALEVASPGSMQNAPTLFPYSKWQLSPDVSRRYQLRMFSQNIVDNANARGANEQRAKLAQIYLGEGLAAECLGMLDGISRTDPIFYRTSKFAALHGAANFLMYRFSDAARDFSASELNNNKEAEFWRAILADILGTPTKYDFFEMNTDYISKYPPLFRQRIAILAADHAIDAKDYNSALKMFDSLQPPKEVAEESKDTKKEKKDAKQEKKEAKTERKSEKEVDEQYSLLTPIKPYVNYLFAKIAVETGQDKEGLLMWNELAQDYNHPFVQARAEFSRIVWDMNHEGLKREQAIDRLERMHINWHGDGLELKVLELLGNLYNERKDYVNAMRIWNAAISTFPSAPISIDMAHKMQEAFIQLFAGDSNTSLSPMEGLTLYYQYKAYAPTGSIGRDITNRLADRLVAIDLLEQAANLLDHQMRFDADKIQRSKIGTKVASIYLLAHQPRKALAALQNSVYGENPTSIQMLRNRLIAEALYETNESAKAAQLIAHDESIEAERIRLNIFWEKKDWSNVISTSEGILKHRKGTTTPLSPEETDNVLKLALAYVFQNNKLQLQYLHDYFGPLMAKSPNKQVFDFITASDVIPTPENFNDVITHLSDTRSFVENYHAHVQTAGLESKKPAAAAATAKP